MNNMLPTSSSLPAVSTSQFSLKRSRDAEAAFNDSDDQCDQSKKIKVSEDEDTKVSRMVPSIK